MSEDPLSERDVEDVLAGCAPSDHPDCAEAAEWVARLREASRAEPAPAMDLRLQAQLRAALDRHAIALSAESGTSDEIVAIVMGAGNDNSANASGASSGDPRRRWRAAGMAAVVLMVVGVVAGVRLAGSEQTDDPGVRSGTASDLPDEGGSLLDDPTDGDGSAADESTELVPKEPPPPAEPDPTLPPTAEPPATGRPPAPDSGASATQPAEPAPRQGRSARSEPVDSDWYEEICERFWPSPERGNRGRGGSPGPDDVWAELCDLGSTLPPGLRD